jgi:hypothetical protein
MESPDCFWVDADLKKPNMDWSGINIFEQTNTATVSSTYANILN